MGGTELSAGGMAVRLSTQTCSHTQLCFGFIKKTLQEDDFVLELSYLKQDGETLLHSISLKRLLVGLVLVLSREVCP